LAQLLQELPGYQLEAGQQLADLQEADPQEVDLQVVDPREADLRVVDPREADLRAVLRREVPRPAVLQQGVHQQEVAPPQSALHRLSLKGIRLVRKLQPAGTKSP
jgi:hypothetical protein